MYVLRDIRHRDLHIALGLLLFPQEILAALDQPRPLFSVLFSRNVPDMCRNTPDLCGQPVISRPLDLNIIDACFDVVS